MEDGEEKNDPEGIRTLNLLIRSQTPYPLGHEAGSRNECNRAVLYR